MSALLSMMDTGADSGKQHYLVLSASQLASQSKLPSVHFLPPVLFRSCNRLAYVIECSEQSTLSSIHCVVHHTQKNKGWLEGESSLYYVD